MWLYFICFSISKTSRTVLSACLSSWRRPSLYLFPDWYVKSKCCQFESHRANACVNLICSLYHFIMHWRHCLCWKCYVFMSSVCASMRPCVHVSVMLSVSMVSMMRTVGFSPQCLRTEMSCLGFGVKRSKVWVAACPRAKNTIFGVAYRAEGYKTWHYALRISCVAIYSAVSSAV